MENYSIFRQALTIVTVSAVLAVFITNPAAAQDTPKADAMKTVKIKIIKEDSGKTTVIDTVYSTGSALDSKEIQALVQQAGGKCTMKVFAYDDNDEMPEGIEREFKYSEGSTLSDLLDNIPMERVKSYSIKDRKNGKRIIIDIDDAPLMENRNKVIVIRGNPHQSAAHSK